MKGAVRQARRSSRWWREGKKGGGDECKVDEFQGKEKRDRKGEVGSFMSRRRWERLQTAYYGAKPNKAKLIPTGNSGPHITD